MGIRVISETYHKLRTFLSIMVVCRCVNIVTGMQQPGIHDIGFAEYKNISLALAAELIQHDSAIISSQWIPMIPVVHVAKLR